MKLPPGTRRLTTPRQIEAVSSPLRLELLEHLRHAGQLSVTDLGQLVGRRPTVLHYHVNLLREAGIIRESARRRAGKRTEALYRLTASEFAVVGRAPGDPSDPAVSRTLGATLRLAQRDAVRALRSGGVVAAGPQRNLHMRRLRAPLSAVSVRAVNRLLDRLETVFVAEVKARTRRPAPDEDTQIVALTFILSSSTRSAGAGGKEHRS